MLGNGRSLELVELFLAAREKGGDDVLWDLMVNESGVGLNIASAVRLVYVKYLDLLERWFGRILEKEGLESGSCVKLDRDLMELEAELKGLLSEISDRKKTDEEYAGSDLAVNLLAESKVVELDGAVKIFGNEEVLSLNLPMSFPVCNLCDSDEIKSVVVESVGTKKFVYDEEFSSLMDLPIVRSKCNDIEVKSEDYEAMRSKNCSKLDDETKSMTLGAEVVKSINRKRKRDFMLGMMKWVTGVAKNPCDPVTGSLTETSKWKAYEKKELWKQVLMVREFRFLKRNVGSSDEQSVWQKNQKMHPCLYEENIGPSYNLRERLKSKEKLIFGKTSQKTCLDSSSSGTQTDLDRSPSSPTAVTEDQPDKKLSQTTDTSTVDSMFENHPRRKIPLGRTFQAEVPEWTGMALESDPKWLGTRDWPLLKLENKFLIERDRIGKGRQDSCGCQVPSSIECVRFHIGEKRFKVKLELGSAFLHWKFNKIGEEVALFWTKEEEKKFNSTMKINPPSGTTFWDQIFKRFRTKSREHLVSYYFNVFLLRHRGYQNRFTPDEINSDDDETEPVGHKAVKSPTSILYSPNKPHTGNK